MGCLVAYLFVVVICFVVALAVSVSCVGRIGGLIF